MEHEVDVGAPDKGDEILDVQFYSKMVDGQEVDFINIKVPGDKTLEIDEVASEYYQQRFARKYEAFKALQGQEGTSIDEWPDASPALKRELAYHGFRFVEQVAGAPDSSFQRIMGGTQWRLKAQMFLNRNRVSESEMLKKQQTEIDELRGQLAELVAQKGGRRKEAEAA